METRKLVGWGLIAAGVFYWFRNSQTGAALASDAGALLQGTIRSDPFSAGAASSLVPWFSQPVQVAQGGTPGTLTTPTSGPPPGEAPPVPGAYWRPIEQQWEIPEGRSGDE